MKRVLVFAVLVSFMVSGGVSIASTLDLPRTGQRECFDTSGTEIDCAGTGQDGAIRAGVAWPDPRFVITHCGADGPCKKQESDCDNDPSNDVVTDTLTGLMWARYAGAGTGTWAAALSHANNLNLCGHADWRLPNVLELDSLENARTPWVAWLTSQGFTGVERWAYWTSTTYSYDPSLAWMVCDSGVNQFQKSGGDATLYILPVRGISDGPAPLWKTGQTQTYAPGDDGDLRMGVAWPSPRFTDHGDGTVTDNLTGLMWTKDAHSPGMAQCDVTSEKPWQGVLDHIGCLNGYVYLGHDDWRLANMKELVSLMDYSRSYYPIAPGHPFVDLYWSFYWSSTTVSYLPERAWGLYGLWNGGVHLGPKTSAAPFWPVRGGRITPIPVNHTLTVQKAGPGAGTVTSDPPGIACGPNCILTKASFAENGTVTLTATPEPGSSFASWEGGCAGSAPTCTVTMSGEETVTARFVMADTKKYKLKIKKTTKGGDGIVTSDDGHIDCGEICSHAYPKGAIVTLTAQADEGSSFLGWKPESLRCAGTGPCAVTMEEAITVQAIFADACRLKVVNQGKRNGSGTVKSTPKGISCATGDASGCEAVFACGQAVTLSASPRGGSTFLGWGPEKLCSGTGTCVVTVDKSRTVKAAFRKNGK